MGISLLTMAAGNVKVLKETFKSFWGFVDEIVFGDLLLFPDDRNTVVSYQKEFNLKTVKLPFDYIFHHGFADTLNLLTEHASNDLVIYMNCSEIIGINNGAADIIKNNPGCNTFYFDHATDPHRWFRCYNRKELKWSGIIHEQLVGEYRPYHKPIFEMVDLPKDMDDVFKAKVFDTTKEIIYFNQYCRLVEHPELLGETDAGWLHFAKTDYDSFKQRLATKGDGYIAFCEGYYEKFMHYVLNDPAFAEQRFESSIAIEYQNDKKYLL